MEFQLADLEDITQDLIARIRKIRTEQEQIKEFWNLNNPKIKALIEKLRKETSQTNNVFRI